ncbi:MAG TPA: hypothetical protein VJ785_10965, partial [Anaerolineales bacterium]|nr:hypothetical protein [Anaerolineales bacterium]
MFFPEIDVLTDCVLRIFHIEDVTAGDGKSLVARYRGHLINEDSAAAYDRLAESLRPYKITPLFRKDAEKQVILLVPSLALPVRSPRIWINIVLFIATVFSLLLMGV